MRTCDSSQPMLFAETELASTSSAEGSPARTSASRARAQGSLGSAAAYGASSPVLLASFDPNSSSWRTSQRCWVEGWTVFSETWPRSGLMRNGTAYRLPPLAPLTGGTECGLLPTPEASNTKLVALRSGGREPKDFSKPLWPTPNVYGLHNRPGASAKSGWGLSSAVKLWPTPTAITDTGGAAMCKWGGSGSRAKLATMVTPVELNGSLNPTWVEWLMGFPLGWTDCGG